MDISRCHWICKQQINDMGHSAQVDHRVNGIIILYNYQQKLLGDSVTPKLFQCSGSGPLISSKLCLLVSIYNFVRRSHKYPWFSFRQNFPFTTKCSLATKFDSVDKRRFRVNVSAQSIEKIMFPVTGVPCFIHCVDKYAQIKQFLD